MGTFDTIHFKKPFQCPGCQAEIHSVQTKAFEWGSMEDYHIGDCVTHAEEIRIVREELYCEKCLAYDKQYIYLVIYRGILIDVVEDPAVAESLLHSFCFERLILWYHDLYAKLARERCERRDVERFLHEMKTWYEKKGDRDSEHEGDEVRLFSFPNRELLEKSSCPIEAIQNFLEKHPPTD